MLPIVNIVISIKSEQILNGITHPLSRITSFIVAAMHPHGELFMEGFISSIHFLCGPISITLPYSEVS